MKQGAMELSERARSVLRTIGAMLALVAGAAVMVGSSCTVAWCWDHHDDDCPDDCGGCGNCSGSSASATRRAQVDWTLRDFALLEAADPGAARAAALLSIRGFSLARQLGPGRFGDVEIRHFAERVVLGNPVLFELPEGAGRLRFDGIDCQERLILVRHAQELVSGEDVATPVPGAAITFVLDRGGRLLEAWNTTRHDVGARAGQ